MKMGMELEATKSVRTIYLIIYWIFPHCLHCICHRGVNVVFHTHPQLCWFFCRSWMRNGCLSRSTCRGTCSAPTLKSCTSSSPSSPTTWHRVRPRGASSPASPSTSTLTKSSSARRRSTSPPPLRKTALSTSTSRTRTTSSLRP